MLPDHGLQLFEGWVVHERHVPKPHKFRYAIHPLWVDLQQLSDIDKICPLWSSRRLAPVRFKRQNYLPGKGTVYDQACTLIHQHDGSEFKGRIYMLSNLAVWGVCFNPVSFYFCYDAAHRLLYILSEIHNTPWGERHTYVHSQDQHIGNATQQTSRFRFDKEFHVSPFMPMDLQNDWTFHVTSNKIFVTMRLLRKQQKLLKVSMRLTGQPLTQSGAYFLPLRYPLTCIKVFTAIYWQALVLWLKRLPFYDHPATRR